MIRIWSVPLRYCGVAFGAWSACAAAQWSAFRNLAETGLAFDDARSWSSAQGLSIRATGVVYLAFMTIAFSRFTPWAGREPAAASHRVLVSALAASVWIALVESLFFIGANDYASSLTKTDFERKVLVLGLFAAASMIGAATVLFFTRSSLRYRTGAAALAQVVSFAGILALAAAGAVLFLPFNYRPVWVSFVLGWQVGVTFLSVRETE